jgi:hypothetical protein
VLRVTTTALAALALAGIFAVSQASPSAADSLVAATQRGDMSGVEKALARGARVDAADADGWTALMYAASRGRYDVSRRLLLAGADPNLADRAGATPLIVLATFFAKAQARHAQAEEVAAYTRTAEALIDGGADVDLVDATGNTAMSRLAGSDEGSELGRKLRAGGALTSTELGELKADLERLAFGTGLRKETGVGAATREAVALLEARTGKKGKGLPNRSAMERLQQYEAGLRKDMLARVQGARGVLDGAHGVYNAFQCEAVDNEWLGINRILRLQSEWIVWSDASTVYMAVGRRYQPMVSRVIEELPGAWTYRWTESTVDKTAYRDALSRALDKGDPLPASEPYTTRAERQEAVRNLRVIEQVKGEFKEFNLFIGNDFIVVGQGSPVIRRCPLQ